MAENNVPLFSESVVKKYGSVNEEKKQVETPIKIGHQNRMTTKGPLPLLKDIVTNAKDLEQAISNVKDFQNGLDSIVYMNSEKTLSEVAYKKSRKSIK